MYGTEKTVKRKNENVKKDKWSYKTRLEKIVVAPIVKSKCGKKEE